MGNQIFDKTIEYKLLINDELWANGENQFAQEMKQLSPHRLLIGFEVVRDQLHLFV